MKILASFDRKLHDRQVQKEMTSQFDKSIRIDERSPKEKHISCIISLAGDSQGARLLQQLITSVKLEYEVPKMLMSSYADATSPMGNSVHSPSSRAYRTKQYFGLGAFKALYVLHRVFQGNPDAVLANVDVYLEWMDRRLNYETGCGGEYGNLAFRYAAYLRALIAAYLAESFLAPEAVSSDDSVGCKFMESFFAETGTVARCSPQSTIRMDRAQSSMFKAKSKLEILLEDEMSQCYSQQAATKVFSAVAIDMQQLELSN